ncbi:M3 family metallopeptidase [Capnocytophaga canimorsus]|uniref:M3 family metallopeptidase n=1 Tax=Capnocytophaga canimorsus TaxID=28188 RepID=UPI000BB16B59|nr:M3 family metallopeptidase [Capnocytophaga canimorsus]ATA76881.1 dipeptidyl carboxypeptidase II [Capnocytophaga canimorsus]PJI83989.1 peptidyl-dipeptidase Dcp [Capnocytophaga canimorsus]STA72085.1 Peptidyl-dipeptidase dcp [Capnocytophaga canimorsus]
MKKSTFLITSAFVLAVVACKQSKTTPEIMPENPLLQQSTLPYFAPDFTKFTDADYRPALLKGMELQTLRVKSITESTQKPTFENTIVALEESGVELGRASRVFFALAGAHTNDTIKNIQRELAPQFAAHSDAIYLNEALFERVKSVYNERQSLDLDAESLKLLEYYYEEFVIAGANLSDQDKKTLKTYNAEIAALQTEFNQTLLDANNASAQFFTDEKALEGLTADQLTAIKTDKGTWKVAILNTTQQPYLAQLKNRATRKQLFDAAWNRADVGKNSTHETIKKIVRLRAQKAKLLGFDNYAEWALQKTMVKTPQNIHNFFKDLIPAATAKAKEEAQEIQKMISLKDAFILEPYDWNFYAEQVRRAKFDLDENEIKPYFELKNVLEKGVFFAMEKLYGVTYKQRTDIPVYHPDVLVYELFEEDGTPLGLFYGDFFARESKRGGAWMSNFVGQSKLLGTKPVIYNVCNYPKPAQGAPALLTYDEVETLFHEFGHALHGFFANQMYPSLSGTAVARDFVEFPSQVNENWALYPEVLKNYAIHYKTGEVIPQTLIDKIKKAATFNQGYSFTEVLAAANLDLQWHTLSADTPIDQVNAFEKQALKDTNLWLEQVPPRYRSTYFAHIFGGNYGAGYYSYQWTEMLHHDAFQWFLENGGMTRANGQRLRDMVLSRGNTMDYEKMYRDFRGKAPAIEPMLKARGLK